MIWTADEHGEQPCRCVGLESQISSSGFALITTLIEPAGAVLHTVLR